MATFAKQTFSAISYAAIRPTYPQALYDAVYAFHMGGRGRAIDLGCGTGQATRALAAAGFEQVIGMDPAIRMIELARVEGVYGGRVRYMQGEAEKLEFLEDGSVDLVVSAQAAHWFDWERLWPELARVLRPDGTVAFWGYSEFRIRNHPSVTPLIHAYAQGADALGPYWEQPGRRIVDNHLRDIPRAPEESFTDHEHIFWTGDYYREVPCAHETILRKKVSWAGLQEYLRTYSALHTYHETHPEDAARRTGLAVRPTDGEAGDIAERFWWSLQEEVVGREGSGDENTAAGTEIEWPLAMVMCRRRG